MDVTIDFHPSDEALRAHHRGELEVDMAELVGRHLESCPDCQRRARELTPDRPIERPGEAHAPPDRYASILTQAGDPALAPTEFDPAASTTGQPLPGLPAHPDYEITRELGRGGMGVVYLARNKLMGRTEVLKVVGSHLLDKSGVVDRFLTEIRNAARLHHPNIVTAYSALRLGDSLVLAMEHVDGLDLAKMVKAKGPMPVANACNYAHQAALGLQHAHEHGMVHRDIKPSNLMLAREGSRAVIKVLDFGLAKIQSEGAINGAMTIEGQLLGSPAYMAPEQIRDARLADIRADIYSLGCTIYELLTGAPPFRGANLFEILVSHQSMDATPLNRKRPDVPVELADLVAKMMAKEPGRRFQAPAEVARALAPFFRRASRAAEAPRLGDGRKDDPALGIATEAAIQEVAAPALAPAPTAGADRDRARPEEMWKSLIDFTEPVDIPEPPAVATEAGGKGRRWSWAAGGLAGFAATLLCAGIFFRKATDKGGIGPEADAPVRGDRAVVTATRIPPPAAPAPAPGSTDEVAEKADPKPPDEPVRVEGSTAPMDRGPEAPPVASQVVAGPVTWNGWPKGDPAPALAPFDAARARAHQEAWSRHLGVPVEYVNSVGMKFVLIPPGEFTMGGTPAEIEEALKAAGEDGLSQARIRSEAPRHKVILTQPTYLAVHEVSQKDYQATMGKNPSFHARNGPEARSTRKGAALDPANSPVEGVSWNDAAEFCARLSQRENRTPFYSRSGETISRLEGSGYRLPTEAEWEFACRAGTTTKYAVGDRDEDLGGVGWFAKNAGGRTHNEGKLKGNPFGLFDMHGNVSEWSEDWWGPTYYAETGEKPAIDPEGPSSSTSRRVIRGGSWNQGASSCRSSGRDAADPTNRDKQTGFRVLLTVDSVQKTLDRNPAPVAANPGRRGSRARAPRPAVAPFDASQARAFQQAWARSLGLPVEYVNSIGMKFILIPPGEFTMGSTPAEMEAAINVAGSRDADWPRWIRSEAPRHKVILTQPTYLGIHEVRQKDYQAVMGTNPSYYAKTGPVAKYVVKVAGLDTANFPVGGVRWDDAAEFCSQLSRKEALKPFYSRAGDTVTRLEGTGYRLPTEAEWEFACRAGTTTMWWSGDRAEDLVGVGWLGTQSGNRMHDVGELKSNPFGLFDMHGNAAEWVEDGWDPTFYQQFSEKPAINPCCSSSIGFTRVSRGGNDRNYEINCRSSTRVAVGREDKTYMFMYGFRVTLPADAVKQAIEARGLPAGGRSDGPAASQGR